MDEVFPVAAGLLIGGFLGAIRPSMRLRVAVVLGAIVAVLATILSGEFEVSWAFILIDGPLVAVSTVAGFALVHHFRVPRSEGGE